MKAWIMKEALAHENLTKADAISKVCALEEIAVPDISSGELLVKVSRGTINPNDLLHIKHDYTLTSHIELPRKMGFEGAGTVVASKGSFMAPSVGTRVAFYARAGGLFGEYAVVDEKSVLPVPKGVSFETAACSMANPFTAVIMVDQVRSLGKKIFVNTAAASALGKLIIRYAKSVGMEVICVVRREEQAEVCRKEGAKYIVDSSSATFGAELSKIMEETECTYIYDCICGSMTGTLLEAGPRGTILSCYGNLSGQDASFSLKQMARNKEIHEFALPNITDKMWLISMILAARKVSNGMGNIFNSDVQKSFPLSKLPDAYAYYASNMSKGKVQIVAEADE